MGIFLVPACSIESLADSRLACAPNNLWYDTILLAVSAVGSTARGVMPLRPRGFLLEFSL